MSDRAPSVWQHREHSAVPHAPPRYILHLHQGADCQTVIQQLEAKAGGFPAGSLYALPLIHALSCPTAVLDAAIALPDVAAAEPDRKPASVHGFSFGFPWLQPPQEPEPVVRRTPFVPWGVKRIQAHTVWAKTLGDKIRIAVIDTGIDDTHPDLAEAFGGGINLIDPRSPPDDDNGHGTHISGTIAAYSKTGMTGTAPAATIYAVKAFDETGSSYVTDIVRGIEWCIRQKIHIINMSFGMKTRSSALEAAVRAAADAGVIIVASAGNEGKKGGVDYPARFPETIAVGATTRSNKIAGFSNYGPEIDIYAPGDKVLSTWMGGRYQTLSGTSMATSHVSGAIALMLSLKPKLKLPTVVTYLQNHATPILTSKRRAGYLGELNAARSVKALLRSRSRRKASTSRKA